MFKKMQTRSLALAAVALAVGLGSHQALATSQTGHASAAIVQAIAVTENTQMNFGFIIPPAGAANVVLTPANAISGAGFTFLGGNAAGNFTALGTTSQPAVITFSSGDTLTGPGTAMALDTFTTDAGGSPVFTAGSLTFDVGATLHVGASQTAGSYIGTYTVTVNY
jgi:Mat/Ecp fimbriae major subunit